MLSVFKNIIFRYVKRWFRFFGKDCTASLPEGLALVIAPHPDDETIGCGTTIARFCAEGRKVRVLIVTDGNASTQSTVITPDELSVIRRNETLKAASILGLAEDAVSFLSFPDNQTTGNIKQIAEAIEMQIAKYNPAIIFTPHNLDEHADHRVLASIVGQLQDAGKTKATILQYPVWYQTFVWPFGIMGCLASMSMYKRIRYVSAGNFLAKKREALLAHRSQFENITGEPGWQFFSAASRRRFCDTSELFFERIPSANSGNFSVEVHDDIRAIEDDWKALEKECVLTPFQKRAWLLPLYNVLAPQLGAKPMLVLVRDRLSGRPLMLLPLCARRRYGMTIIEFADLGVSDYNAPILSGTFNPSEEEWLELWHGVKAALKKGSILWLKKMPQQIGDRSNPLMHYGKKNHLMSNASWGVPLPATFAEYSKSVLPPSFAKELAKKLRRTTKRGTVEYTIAKTKDEKHAAFEVLAKQRQVRCDEMGRKNNMAQAAYHQFYEAAVVNSPEPVTTLGVLKVGGEIVGTLCALTTPHSAHMIMSTYQGGEWKTCSLGNIVIQSAIEHSIHNGMNFFDFTIGNENYKQDFGATPSSLHFTLQPLALFSSPIVIALICGAHTKKASQQMAVEFKRRIGKWRVRTKPQQNTQPAMG